MKNLSRAIPAPDGGIISNSPCTPNNNFKKDTTMKTLFMMGVIAAVPLKTLVEGLSNAFGRIKEVLYELVDLTARERFEARKPRF